MERLKVQQVQEIIHRLRQGQSEREIVRDLGCARGTIRRYKQWAKGKGFLSPDSPTPSDSDFADGPFSNDRVRSSNTSSVAPYKEVVEQLLNTGVEMKAIHRRLRNSHGFTGGYSSVRRYVANVRPPVPDVVVRMETEAGHQAQVDFGSVGKMYDPVMKRLRTAYCFVMTLSCSRHQFVRFVFLQTIPVWLECHRLAFEFFEGVVREVVIDNLKSAVIRHSFDDCVLGLPYNRFARHYGFLVHPCRPRTPEHKGKVENGVHYVQRNFIASEDIGDINDANVKVLAWVMGEAGLRKHGTTQAVPLQCFLELEKPALQELPPLPFDLECVVYAKAHRDCHVQALGSYYSYPWEHVGKSLDVYIYAQMVQVFDGMTMLTSHERSLKKGGRVTRIEHYPPEKSIYLIRTRSWCLNKAGSIGPKCHEVVQGMLDERPLDRLRSAQGVMSLADKYTNPRVEAACARALAFSDTSYGRIKSILVAGTDRTPADTTVQLTLADYTFARLADEFFDVPKGGWIKSTLAEDLT